MNYKTLYEFSIFESWAAIFILSLIIFFGFIMFKLIRPTDNEEEEENVYQIRLGFIYLISIILIGAGSILMVFANYGVIKTAQIYHNGEFKIIQGYISNYDNTRPKGPDTFKIENINFELSKTKYISYGYGLRQAEGGILKDSMFVRISYYGEKGDYLILKIVQFSNN